MKLNCIKGGLRTKGIYKTNSDKLPLITVITVVLNGASVIEKTIQSVINQSYKNIEYIVIDGGSTDATLDILRKYDDAIDYWISSPDDGIYSAMNKGVSLARGEWINMMNAGDYFSSHSVLEESNLSDNHNYDFLYSDALMTDGATTNLRKCAQSKNRYVHQAVIYRKKLHRELGNYLVAKNITISEYIFMLQVDDSRKKKINTIIATCPLGGVSSARSHFYQTIAIDLLFSKRSRFFSALILVFYPAYNWLKSQKNKISMARRIKD